MSAETDTYLVYVVQSDSRAETSVVRQALSADEAVTTALRDTHPYLVGDVQVWVWKLGDTPARNYKIERTISGGSS